MKFRSLVFGSSLVAASALAAAAFLVPAATAEASGSTSGSLGTGGVATGDISMQAGETDVVDVTLVEGSAVDLTFSAGFSADLVCLDEHDTPVDLGFTAGSRRLAIRDWAPPATGTFRFSIASADGSQGGYTLVVRPKWAKKVPFSGVGQQTLDFAMPANGSVSGLFKRAKGAPGQPTIVSLDGPGGQLAGPIDATGSVVKLPSTATPASGMYQLTVSSTDGTSGWSGFLLRRAPATRPTKLQIRNGIDQVSFAESGLDSLFSRRCGGCHSWANSWQQMRGAAGAAIAKIKAGSMPPDGRIPQEQIALIQSWIATGRAR